MTAYMVFGDHGYDGWLPTIVHADEAAQAVAVYCDRHHVESAVAARFGDCAVDTCEEWCREEWTLDSMGPATA